ncbi:MAG: DUF1573 domain-containing protein [Calditrichia bacterium]
MRLQKSSLIIVLLLFALTAWAQDFELLTPPVLDIGTVPSDTIAGGVIRFKNAGDSTIVIGRVETSCGCTVVNLDKLTYNPGEEGMLPVRFNTKGYSGTVRKRIDIMLEKGEPSDTRVILQARVIPQIEIEPRFVDFQNASIKEKPIRREITIKNNMDRTLYSDQIMAANPELKIEPESISVAPGDSVKLWVNYKPEKPERNSSTIMIKFSKPFKMERRIPVFMYVHE